MNYVGELIRMSFHKNGFGQYKDQSGEYDNLEGFTQRFGIQEKRLIYLRLIVIFANLIFFPQVFQAIRNKTVEVGIIAVELHDMYDQHLDNIRNFYEEADSADIRLQARDSNVLFCNGYLQGEHA